MGLHRLLPDPCCKTARSQLVGDVKEARAAQRPNSAPLIFRHIELGSLEYRTKAALDKGLCPAQEVMAVHWKKEMVAVGIALQPLVHRLGIKLSSAQIFLKYAGARRSMP